MRYDTFILWPPTADVILDGVLAILRRRAGLKLVRLKRLEVGGLKTFVDQVYALDAVPIEHLRSKLEYLSQAGPSRVYVGVVRNLSPAVERVGIGTEFEHDQCQNIVSFKSAVRAEYNPPGTEHHVIHASDTETQAQQIISLCGMPPTHFYDFVPCADFPGLPYHLVPFHSYRLVRSVGRNICRRELGKEWPIPLAGGPHDQFVRGDKSEYEAYWRANRGVALTEDHSPGAFEELIANPSLADETPVITRDGVILDGVHRMAINPDRLVLEVLA